MLGRPPSSDREEITDEDVLRMLDELEQMLGSPTSTPSKGSVPPPTETAFVAPAPPAAEPPRVPAGASSPYLEDRLEGARGSVQDLKREVHEVARRAETLQGAVQTLESELGRASDELRFARTHGLLGEAPSTPLASLPPPATTTRAVSRATRASATPTLPAVAVSASPGGGRYRDFTAARYNQTMSELKQRRRVVAAIALVTAAIVSALLVAVAFVSHGPEPPVWLEALPGIWMIPVPFFMLGFRGTHRILRRNHFDLPQVR